MANLVSTGSKSFIDYYHIDVSWVHSPTQIIKLKDGKETTLRAYLLDQTVSETDTEEYLMHVDKIGGRYGGLKFTCLSTMKDILRENINALDQHLCNQLEETSSYEIITRTAMKGRGSYSHHMYP